MASGEYRDCPPRLVRGSAAHSEIASSVNHTVTLPQAGVVGWPVRYLAPLPRNMMAAVLVQLEWHSGHPEFGRIIPYATLRLSTTFRSMHHARQCNTLIQHSIAERRWLCTIVRWSAWRWVSARARLSAEIAAFDQVAVE